MDVLLQHLLNKEGVGSSHKKEQNIFIFDRLCLDSVDGSIVGKS